MNTLLSQVSSGIGMMPPLRLLVVDDSRFDRARIRRYCDQSGQSVSCHEADGLADMTQQISRGQFDIFVLDYFLPVGTGLAALHTLKARSDTRNAGIIMMTGCDETGMAAAAEAAGCDLFMTKTNMNADRFCQALLELKLEIIKGMKRDRALFCQAQEHVKPAGHNLQSENTLAEMRQSNPQRLLDWAVEMMQQDDFVFNQRH